MQLKSLIYGQLLFLSPHKWISPLGRQHNWKQHSTASLKDRMCTSNKRSSTEVHGPSYYQKYNYIIIDMQNNEIASGWKTLRGSINAKKGTCAPDSFAILEEQYNSNVLQIKYDISIRSSKKNSTSKIGY